MDAPSTTSAAAPANRPDFAGWAGDVVRRAIDFPNPMGTWTGLPREVGAPVSGALWGAGLGALVGGVSDLLKPEEEDAPPRPWWRKPWVLGAGAGTALGLASGSGLLSKLAGSSELIVETLMRDRSLSDTERNRLIQAVMAAEPSQLRQLLAAAMAGTLTAALANRILGTGVLGSSILGGLAGLVAHNIMPGATRYI